jgi:hypothetical protein
VTFITAVDKPLRVRKGGARQNRRHGRGGREGRHRGAEEDQGSERGDLLF